MYRIRNCIQLSKIILSNSLSPTPTESNHVEILLTLLKPEHKELAFSLISSPPMKEVIIMAKLVTVFSSSTAVSKSCSYRTWNHHQL